MATTFYTTHLFADLEGWHLPADLETLYRDLVIAIQRADHLMNNYCLKSNRRAMTGTEWQNIRKQHEDLRKTLCAPLAKQLAKVDMELTQAANVVGTPIESLAPPRAVGRSSFVIALRWLERLCDHLRLVCVNPPVTREADQAVLSTRTVQNTTMDYVEKLREWMLREAAAVAKAREDAMPIRKTRSDAGAKKSHHGNKAKKGGRRDAVVAFIQQTRYRGTLEGLREKLAESGIVVSKSTLSRYDVARMIATSPTHRAGKLGYREAVDTRTPADIAAEREEYGDAYTMPDDD